MSLPNGMKWLDVVDPVSGDTHSFVEHEEGEIIGYELVQSIDMPRLYLSLKIVAKDGMLNRIISEAQAELIIRAIEAPESLEVKDE